MATHTKNFNDLQSYSLETRYEDISDVEKDFITACYGAISNNVTNMSSINRDIITRCRGTITHVLGFAVNTDLDDWTTKSLLTNASFSESENEQPYGWVLSNNFGEGLGVKVDNQTYYTSPLSLKIKYEGTTGRGRYVSLYQNIPIQDILQVNGKFRLLFRYKTNDSGITIKPIIILLNKDKQQLGNFPLTSKDLLNSALWNVYDCRIPVTSSSSKVKYLQLMLLITRNKDGAFQLNLDDLDFHYYFSIDYPPTFPSAVGATISTVFSRLMNGKGFAFYPNEGKSKLQGTLDFAAISLEQFKHLRAAYMFHAGHRLNVKSVMSHRADVSFPSLLSFDWTGGFVWSPSSMDETRFDVTVALEET